MMHRLLFWAFHFAKTVGMFFVTTDFTISWLGIYPYCQSSKIRNFAYKSLKIQEKEFVNVIAVNRSGRHGKKANNFDPNSHIWIICYQHQYKQDQKTDFSKIS